MSEKTDLIIVGGGALGTFHAYHALKAGLSVRLFEKNSRPRGATVRNFGQVVPSGFNSKWQGYGRKSLEVYKTIQSKTDITVRPNGSVYLASDEEEMILLEELADINKNNDYSSELLTKKQCLEKYTGLKESYVKGGLFFPEEITVDARNMIHKVLDYLMGQKGFSCHFSTTIQSVQELSGSCQVEDNRGNAYYAEQVIICSGDDFKTLFPDIFDESDIEISKIQMLQTVPQKELRVDGNILTGLTIRRYESFQECPSYPAIHAKEDAEAYWKKWGIHILFKQCPDGSFIIGDSHEYGDAKEADNIGFDIHQAVNEFILDEAKKIFELEDWRLQKEWFGIYSQCKTQDIFQKTIDDCIHIVTGIGGKGMTGSAGFAAENVRKIIGLTSMA